MVKHLSRRTYHANLIRDINHPDGRVKLVTKKGVAKQIMNKRRGKRGHGHNQ